MIMNRQTKFPVESLVEGMSAPAIVMEGQKVLFDKKVSLLPVDTKKQPKSINNGG